MPTAFTHYWKREKLDKGESPRHCTQAFSAQFIQRGVSAGDRVFFVSYFDKRPFLVGAITVAADPVEMDSGVDRITAIPGSGSVKDFERAIPIEIAGQIIRLDTGNGWKFDTPDLLNQQTMRGVQRINAESAALLDSLLGVAERSYGDDHASIDSSTGDGSLYADEIGAGDTFWEGAVSQVIVNRYERDPAARKACLTKYGCICVVCDMDFINWYGERGAGFIHVHHVTPISQLGPDYRVDPIADLVPVCPNCHAMLHRNPPVTVQELQEIYSHHLDQVPD